MCKVEMKLFCQHCISSVCLVAAFVCLMRRRMCWSSFFWKRSLVIICLHFTVWESWWRNAPTLAGLRLHNTQESSGRTSRELCRQGTISLRTRTCWPDQQDTKGNIIELYRTAWSCKMYIEVCKTSDWWGFYQIHIWCVFLFSFFWVGAKPQTLK